MELALAGLLLIGLFAAVVWRVRTGWLGRAMIGLLLLPLLPAGAVLVVALFMTPAEPDALANGFFAVMLLGTFLIVPWLAVWGLGCIAGFGLRRIAPPPARAATASSPTRLGSHGDPTPVAPPEPPALSPIRPGGEPSFSQLSPDGRVRIDILPVEWAASLWVNTPRLVEVASGQELLDLLGTDWEAQIAYPGEGQVWLGLRRYRAPGHVFAQFDLAARRYTISLGSDEPPVEEGPLGEIGARVEHWAREATARAYAQAAAVAPDARPRVAGPGRFAAWRTMLVILVGALVAIAGLTWLSLKTGVEPPHAPLMARPAGVPR